MVLRVGWILGVSFIVLVGALTRPAFASARSQVLYSHGLIAFDEKLWEEAHRLFEQAVQADEQDAVAVYYRGLVAARLGKTEAAIRDLENALRMRPELPGAALNLGILYFDAGRYEPAEPWLRKAHDQPRNRFTAALFLGLLNFRTGNNASAAEFFDDAAKDPDLRATARYYGSLALLRQGDVSEARGVLTELEEAAPESEFGQIAAQYLARRKIRRAEGAALQGRWSGYADIGFEYDSNVLLAPNDAGIEATLPIDKKKDGRSVLGFGGRYRLLDDEILQVALSYDFTQSAHFDLTALDLQGHRLRADIQSRPGRVQYGLSGVYDFYLLDYQSFFHEGIVTPRVTWFQGRVSATQAYYRMQGRDFTRRPFDPFRDSINHAFGVRQIFLLGAVERTLTIGYQFDDENTFSDNGDEFDYRGHQMDLELEFGLGRWAEGVAGYSIRYEDYDSPNSRSPSGFRRHDVEHQFVVGIERELSPHVSLGLHYIADLNRSNIENFEYDRHIVSTNLRCRF